MIQPKACLTFTVDMCSLVGVENLCLLYCLQQCVSERGPVMEICEENVEYLRKYYIKGLVTSVYLKSGIVFHCVCPPSTYTKQE